MATTEMNCLAGGGANLEYALTTYTGRLDTGTVEVLGKVKFATITAPYSSSYIQLVESDDDHTVYQYANNAPEVHNDHGITQIDATHVQFWFDSNASVTWTIHYWYE